MVIPPQRFEGNTARRASRRRLRAGPHGQRLVQGIAARADVMAPVRLTAQHPEGPFGRRSVKVEDILARPPGIISLTSPLNRVGSLTPAEVFEKSSTAPLPRLDADPMRCTPRNVHPSGLGVGGR